MHEKQKALERFEAKFVKTDGCWEWQASFGSQGYGHFWFEGRPRPANQVSYVLYVGPILNGLHVLHHCDNRKCVRPDHLFLGTNRENVDDKVSKSRQLKGEALKTSKLTEDQVRQIKCDKRSQRVIGKTFGVSHTTVGQIKSGLIWRHV